MKIFKKILLLLLTHIKHTREQSPEINSFQAHQKEKKKIQFFWHQAFPTKKKLLQGLFKLQQVSQSFTFLTEWISELVGTEIPILIRNFILKYIVQFTCEVFSI